MPEASPEKGGGISLFALARRGLVAMGIAGTVAAVLRARNGNAETAPASGGWTELGPEDIENY